MEEAPGLGEEAPPSASGDCAIEASLLLADVDDEAASEVSVGALVHPAPVDPPGGLRPAAEEDDAAPSLSARKAFLTRNDSEGFTRSCCMSKLGVLMDDPARHAAKMQAEMLRKAALDGDPEVVRRMIDARAAVNAPLKSLDPDGDIFVTLLHVLSGTPDLARGPEVIAEIARGKANLNARSFLGSTPLARACSYKHVSAARLLLELGADVSPMDDRGRSALHCAVSLVPPCAGFCVPRHEPPGVVPPGVHAEPSEEQIGALSGSLVSLLAGRRADLDCSASSSPPLLEAIRFGNRPALSALIEHGVRPRFLHVAVDNSPAVVIDELIRAQANPFEEDGEGRSVLDVAFRRGDEEITTMLRDFIGDYERTHGVKSHMKLVPPPGPPRRISERSEASSKCNDEDDDEGGLGLASRRRVRPSRDRAEDQAMVPRVSGRSITNMYASVANNIFPRAGEATLLRQNSRTMRREVFARFMQAQQWCRRINRARHFQTAMLVALIVALFFPDFWILFDVENSGSLDAVLVIVFICFCIELLVQTIGSPKTYVNSFFFWMDIIGCLSVPLDHSLVSESLPRSLDNAVVMRAARTARLGARAGRFTKLVKLLRFLPGVHQDVSGSHGTAKRMSNALMTSLSTRVSCLIIFMVMLLPIFDMVTYPENDFSMKAWMDSLEVTLARHGDSRLEGRVLDFEAFYSSKGYFPYEVAWDSANGTAMALRLSGKRPLRFTNQLSITATSGAIRADFNFGGTNRIGALCNVILMLVIIFLMVGFSLLLSNSVSAIVLRPLENLLQGVQAMASNIFTSVTSIAAKTGNGDDEDNAQNTEDRGAIANETELLERVISKLATLSAISMKAHPIDAATLEQMGESDRAVLQGYSPSRHLQTIQVGPASEGDAENMSEELVSTLEKHLEEAGLAWSLVDSWDFNSLEMEEQQRHLSCFCFGIFHLGMLYTPKLKATLANFIEGAAAGYGNPSKIPYHNWYHAVDVTHCVFRLLNLCATERFLSHLERFALVASAVCHDIGHPGLNNPFLIEVAHELAIRYNDRSPLENMHCARLFELAGQPKSAIFGDFDKQQYREVRQVCIEAILHTDNIHHFPMVKELQMLYEMNSDVFDMSLQYWQSGQLDFPPREVCDIFQDPDKRCAVRNLILHFSDISNPTKPFPICKRWAWCIVDEFFLQGDWEKELGIAVQPLNDRDKVNRPYSQVGFVEFFVAPFALATVRLLPPLIVCSDQMMHNLNSWGEEWASTASPPPEAEDVTKLMERIQKLQAKFVFREA